MSSKTALKEVPSTDKKTDRITPHWRQSAKEVQKFGTVIRDLPIGISEDARREITGRLNVLLADTASLRDLYKKAHWHVSGPTFYQLHLLFDKHFEQQVELVDLLAERIQILGGVSIAMAHDIAETTRLERPPKGREEVPVLISRLLEAHKIILEDARKLAEKASDLGDEGTNDLLISDVVRTNELQVWFLSEHLVEMPLVFAD
ncbi:Dps family protein [Pseudacidobacterium ailaaui]|jgi:starvation-inducible DNA-binding protein|uniref:Dps family protein n=1 Tax=Pseudacidobacterium ailaaui TaxID=1382359 RepID=UPI000478E39D|nr:DNA starvation/stationary phase protection protein [Pseudacidobacterium ailaaui]MBX6360803.1 DNA starvation/stationary phase protection protein [Pseudacidobacterium ailaaui]MDI3254466.1 DNA starvation/stationary phase protection protein [Bacillota bacterium]